MDGGSGGGGGGWWWWGAAAVEFGASRTPVALVRGAAQHAPTSTSTRHLRHTAPPTRRPLHPHHPHLRNGHTSPVRVRVAPPAGYAAAAARRRAPLTPPARASELQNQYSNYKGTLQQLASKIGDVEQEAEEHKFGAAAPGYCVVRG